MGYLNNTKVHVVFQYFVLILLKIALFELSNEKEKHFHYYIFITGMCLARDRFQYILHRPSY